MVAYEVQENGDVRDVRVVRHSGIRELDGQLLTAASKWKYKERPGCGIIKVRLAAGPIPNEATALKVAEPELIQVYGADVIGKEKPLGALLSGEMWIVGGTLRCSDGKGGTTTVCGGGVASAHLSKNDGRVLEIFHTK
jgi:TonB family protein